MATKEVDVLFNMQQTGSGDKKTVDGLKKIEQQAQRAKQKMQELSQVGMKLTLVGAAIVAPFALAMKKYTDTVKDTEPTSKRILELSQKWEASQVRLGRVTATVVLPALEAGAAILENVIAFAEKNPDVVRAALTIGATLIVLGGLITTTAQIVSTIATVQGLAASAGIALGGGGAAAGAGGAALGGATAGAAGIITAILPAAVAVLALAIGGNVGLAIGNALAGTNQTWEDVLVTVKQILIINALAFDNVTRFFGNSSNLEGIVSNALGMSDKFVIDANLRTAQAQTNSLSSVFASGAGAQIAVLSVIANAISGLQGLFGGGQAAGGYAMRDGLYRRGEAGREFVMNNQTTRNAERAIGGRLTQERAMSMMTNNYQVGRGTTIRQTRQIIRQEMSGFKDAILSY